MPMDTKEFTNHYAQIHVDLYKFALYVVKHPQDAEDAVSEAVIAAYRNIHKLKKDESFRAWMFTILKNQCLKILKQSHRVVAFEENMAVATPDFTQDHEVRRAFSELSAEDRMIVSFSVFGGYKSDEIGAMMKMNAATVRSRKNRAFEKMRSWLVS